MFWVFFQLGTISFIPKIKSQELDLLQKRAYSALTHMQTAQRAFSLCGCCHCLPSWGRCRASVCGWAEQRGALRKPGREAFMALGWRQQVRTRGLALWQCRRRDAVPSAAILHQPLVSDARLLLRRVRGLRMKVHNNVNKVYY